MSSRYIAIGGAAAAIIIAILLALFFLSGDDDTTDVVTTTPAGQTVRSTPADEVSEKIIPSFDIVRVERDGMAVIAGRSEPRATITLKRNGSTIATAQADGRGEWVIVLETPLEPGDIELTLTAKSPDGSERDSIQSVSVSVPAEASGQALVVLAEPGKASRVLQGPGVPSDAGNLVLEAVDYDENGNVIISGVTEPNTTVRVYLNDKPIGDARADADGRWELRANGSVEPGTYTMRIDQLDTNGQVSARVEVPFERGVAEDVRRQIAEGQVVIQPGNNLWNIARQLYGSGYRYTTIYQANRDQIRDPDLIYPGQVFATPAQ
jgi:LysM domain/Bacterial Ig domain